MGPQALIRVLFKTKIFIENQERWKPIKKWLHIILRKWDFNSKDSKWIFKIDFNEERFEKVFYFKIKEINLKKQQNVWDKILGKTKENEITK